MRESLLIIAGLVVFVFLLPIVAVGLVKLVFILGQMFDFWSWLFGIPTL